MQACPDPLAFQRDVEALFRTSCDILSPQGIDVDLVRCSACAPSHACPHACMVQGLRTSRLLQVLKAMLQLARKHGVTVDSGYAALVIGVCVLVGFATSLDPSLNLLDAATPAYLINDLTGRIAGRLYA